MESVTTIVFVLMMMIRCSSTSRYSADFDRITYLDFTSPVVSALPPTGSPLTTLSVVNSDDSPFARVKLPWAFNFFGNTINNIFVNPNGAIHQTYDQPCSCACFQSGECTVLKSYYGLIAGYLADLNPTASSLPASITSYITGNMVSIIFREVPIYNTVKNMSFRISLFDDSHINIDYDKIDGTQISSKWISGVRPPQFNFHTNFTKVQLADYSSWNTSVLGIYPPRKIKSGSQYTVCPVSLVWGASPSRMNIATPPHGSYLNLTLTPLLYSCQAILDIVLYFNVLADLSSGSSELAKCIYKTGPLPSLLCNISSLSVTVRQGLVDAPSSLGFIGWRVSGTNVQFSRMPIDGIPMSFYRSAIPESRSCALNTFAPASCSDKICHGNYTCLNLPCDLHSPVLYKNPTCGNGTISALDPNTCSTDLAYDRTNNKCCTVEQQDCMGTCFGKFSIGLITLGSKHLLCCPFVDCFNVCKGPALRDACGVCGGRDFKGLTCNTKVKIETGYGSNKMLALTDYSQPKKLSSLGKITITNQNYSNIVVTISISGTNSVSPHISIPSSSVNVTVLPFQSQTFYVNVNLTSLYIGGDSHWEVKTVTLSYTRLSLSPYAFSYPIEIFPGATNCSSVKDIATCMRIPACIFCTNYPSLRILKAEEDIENQLSSEEWTELSEEERYYYSKRKLFTGLVPAQLGDLGLPLAGVCTNGFQTSVCVPYSSSSRINVTYITTFVIFFLIFIFSY